MPVRLGGEFSRPVTYRDRGPSYPRNQSTYWNREYTEGKEEKQSETKNLKILGC